MNTIGAYGVYTVEKIGEFLHKKLAFGQKELKFILKKMLEDDFTFSLRYDVTEQTFKRFWSINQPSRDELNYINSFNNVIVSDKDTPVISPKNSRVFSLPVEQKEDIANKLSGHTIKMNSGSEIFMATFSPDFKTKQDNYLLSTSYLESSGYIRSKAVDNRNLIGVSLSGALFIHQLLTTKDQVLLNIEVGDIQFILRNFGVTEHMLIHHMDVVGNFVCKEINKILKKFKKPLVDGLYFRKNADCVVLCNIKNVTNIGQDGNQLQSMVYRNGDYMYPDKIVNHSVGEGKKIVNKFYDNPRYWVDSYASIFRNTLSQLMVKDVFRTNTLGEKEKVDVDDGLNPSDVNTDLVSVVLASITNALRPYVYKAIQDINRKMAAYGKFIVAGGDAINMLIDPVDRSVSPDIDTKFILSFEEFDKKFDPNSTNPNQQVEMESIYFYKMLDSKRHLWYGALQEILDQWNSREHYETIYNTILKQLELTTPFDILGVTFIPPHQIKNFKPFRKRLTVMPKSSEKDPPFLFDVDLFAIDVYINSIYLIEWEEAEDGSTKWTNRFEYIDKNDQASITGLLDMPYTKPTHLGYNLGSRGYHTNIKIDPFKEPRDLKKFFKIETSLNSIVSIKNDVETGDLPPVGEMTIPIANVDYIKHDVELLARLQLRKGTKLEKDRQRLQILAKYGKIESIDLDEEELHAAETQTNYKNIKVSLSDVATLKVAHIIKYLAVPKFSPDDTQLYGFIECPDSVQYEVVFDTFTRFDYNNSSWRLCCDIIPNMFKFRYGSKQLSNWSKDNDQKNSVLCILKSWKKYLNNIKKLPVEKRLLYIGVMLYGFRPHFLDNTNVAKNPKYVNNLFIDNILIYAVGLRDIGGEISKDSLAVYNALRGLRLK